MVKHKTRRKRRPIDIELCKQAAEYAKSLIDCHHGHVHSTLISKYGRTIISDLKRYGFSIREYTRTTVVPHPCLHEYWAEHNGLVMWWAKKIMFSGLVVATNRGVLGYDDLTGILFIRYNGALFTHDPSVAKFSTYYSTMIYQGVVVQLAKDRQDVEIANRRRAINVQYIESCTSEQQQDIQYRWAKNKDRDAGSIVDGVFSCFDSVDDFWDYACHGLKDTDKRVFMMYYKDGLTLEAIGDVFGVTRERIRQRVKRSLDGAKRRFGTHEEWLSGDKELI